MKFKRKVHEELNINITPLIDVVFLLLIFFMVTTTFTRETRLMVNLPEADGTPSDNPQQVIEVTVSRNGTYSIDGRPLVNSEIETLKQGLQQATQNNTSTPIVVVADAEASHQSVVTAMDGMRQLGLNSFTIATRQPSDSEGASQTR